LRARPGAVDEGARIGAHRLGNIAPALGPAVAEPAVRQSRDGDPSSRRPNSDPATPAAVDLSRLPARDFRRLVDAVVDDLEQRVVDELERRGRRQPGVL
jgi:hypothetical protein